jgi:hypothetical protein
MGSAEKQRLDDASRLAESGDFSGLPVLIEGLRSENDDVRIRAAWLSGRVGSPQAMEALADMARHDPISAIRNQAIFALVGIGRPVVVPVLAEALGDPDRDRRNDARTALYRLLGRMVTTLLADEDEQDHADPEEPVRVMDWWREQSGRFDPERVYFMAEPASPGVFIGQLEARRHDVAPDAILNALSDWTGQNFGRRLPLSGTIRKWQSWWSANREHYEAGRRYFHSYPVP